jgi:peptidoglycan/LPS O-acetylase OafA/YrhL
MSIREIAVKPKQINNTWISGLDSIRFTLAFIVLLSHFDNPWVEYFKFSSSRFYNALSGLIPNLFSGIGAVIAFFIISGFVIHYPNKKGIPDVRKYLLRRWLRIGMPLFVVAIITLYYDCFNYIPIWSLYCELIYYTIYPLLSKIKISWKIKFILSFIISFIFIFIFCQNDIMSLIHQKIIGNYYSGAYWQLGSYLTWIIGLPCWLLGVLLAEKIDTITESISVKKIFFLRILVFVISVVLNVLKFHFFLSYIFSMNLFALIVFVWIKAEILYYRERKPVNILEKMGVFAYSLYLLHSACFLMLKHFFSLNRLSYLIYIPVTIFMSYLFYLLIEKPSHLAAKKIAGKIRSSSTSSVVSR